MANVAYIRVSTIEQSEARQLELLKDKPIDKFFIEKKSGKNTDRPQLKAMLDYIREGDTLYITEFSRLARNTKDLLNIVETLNNKGVTFVSLKENIDTSTNTGKLMLTIFGAIAEFERTLIVERTSEGRKIALENNVKFGRPTVPFDEKLFKKECEKWQKGEQSAVETMRKTGLKKNTFYRKAREYGYLTGTYSKNGERKKEK